MVPGRNPGGLGCREVPAKRCLARSPVRRRGRIDWDRPSVAGMSGCTRHLLERRGCARAPPRHSIARRAWSSAGVFRSALGVGGVLRQVIRATHPLLRGCAGRPARNRLRVPQDRAPRRALDRGSRQCVTRGRDLRTQRAGPCQCLLPSHVRHSGVDRQPSNSTARLKPRNFLPNPSKFTSPTGRCWRPVPTSNHGQEWAEDLSNSTRMLPTTIHTPQAPSIRVSIRCRAAPRRVLRPPRRRWDCLRRRGIEERTAMPSATDPGPVSKAVSAEPHRLQRLLCQRSSQLSGQDGSVNCNASADP